MQAIEQETIDSFDAHNAPELVRCKDCRFGEEWGRLVSCGLMKGSHKPDWFCADGERKEGDGDDKTSE